MGAVKSKSSRKEAQQVDSRGSKKSSNPEKERVVTQERVVVQKSSSREERAPQKLVAREERPPQNKSEGFSEVSCVRFFEAYADKQEDPPVLLASGLEMLSRDLGVDPDAQVFLIIAYLCGSTQLSVFTRDEWLRGMRKLEVDNVDDLKRKLPELEKHIHELSAFREYFRFVFSYVKEEGKRALDLDLACYLLEFVLKERYERHVSLFVQFLRDQKEYRAINADQWASFFEFCRTFTAERFQDYDADGAWPVILDDFVEWAEK